MAISVTMATTLYIATSHALQPFKHYNQPNIATSHPYCNQSYICNHRNDSQTGNLKKNCLHLIIFTVSRISAWRAGTGSANRISSPHGPDQSQGIGIGIGIGINWVYIFLNYSIGINWVYIFLNHSIGINWVYIFLN